MKLLFLAWVLVVGTPSEVVHRITPLNTELAAPSATVYVCMSKSSVAYHASDNCAGLNRCNHYVKAMNVSAAQELGKRACQKCY